MPDYQVYNAGISTGTQYLTKEAAYFLGGIYAADEKVSSGGKLYWASPVRYNPTYSTPAETAAHFDCVRQIAAQVGGYTVMRENIRNTPLDSGKNRLPGFSTFFASTGLANLADGIPALKDALLRSSGEVQKAFIIGVMDGRGTPDASAARQTIRYLSLDCTSAAIGDFLSEIIVRYGLSVNYNTARDRAAGGAPRRPQLRIRDVRRYMENTGYISPAKVRKLAEVYQAVSGRAVVTDASAFLPGLKYLRG